MSNDGSENVVFLPSTLSHSCSRLPRHLHLPSLPLSLSLFNNHFLHGHRARIGMLMSPCSVSATVLSLSPCRVDNTFCACCPKRATVLSSSHSDCECNAAVLAKGRRLESFSCFNFYGRVLCLYNASSAFERIVSTSGGHQKKCGHNDPTCELGVHTPCRRLRVTISPVRGQQKAKARGETNHAQRLCTVERPFVGQHSNVIRDTPHWCEQTRNKLTPKRNTLTPRTSERSNMGKVRNQLQHHRATK